MNYKPISKITIYSIFMGICAIVGIVIFAVDFPNWAKYDSSYLQDPTGPTASIDDLLPVSVQVSRAWSMASLVIFLLLTFVTIWEIRKMESISYKKYYIASLGVFTWLMLPYTFYLGLKDKLYSEFIKYNLQNKDAALQFSTKSLISGLKGGVRNKLFWNTIFGYFVFASTLVSLVFCFLNAQTIFGAESLLNLQDGDLIPGITKEEYYNYLTTSVIFETLSYFTSLTNIASFIFMLAFVLFSQKIAFRNNTIMISIASYIWIVCLIFWTYLFPISVKNQTYVKDFQWVKTTWLHAVTPILFCIFFVTSVTTNKEGPNKIKKIMLPYLIYPITYACYIYPLPFFTRFSVYGTLTNLNPGMSTSVGINVSEPTGFGNPLMAFGIFGLFIVFLLIGFGFWSIPYLINKKENKKNITI